MKVISTNEDLLDLCLRLKDARYVCVDTEFIRVNTYWPELCLIQVATPEIEGIIDPLAPDLELTPFFDLMQNTSVIKVFHSARQDLEILWHLTGALPAPLFDTQVVAQALGFGESVGYETLVNKIIKQSLDKSMRMTDWSQRPLSDRQLEYALSDVTHLCKIFEYLEKSLIKKNRGSWVEEEITMLLSPDTYRPNPDMVWKRLKPRTYNPRYLALLKELAKLREVEALAHNKPRGHILKDDVLLEIAAHRPTTLDKLMAIRGVSGANLKSDLKLQILALIDAAQKIPESELPKVPTPTPLSRRQAAALELLKVFQRIRADELKITPKILATSDELDLAVQSPTETLSTIPCFQGWRMEAWGQDAIELLKGNYSLSLDTHGLKLNKE